MSFDNRLQKIVGDKEKEFESVSRCVFLTGFVELIIRHRTNADFTALVRCLMLRFPCAGIAYSLGSIAHIDTLLYTDTRLGSTN